MQPRTCLVLSAGGSAFETAFELSNSSPNDFYVVTDRACGAEPMADRLGVSHSRIETKDREEFSRAAYETCKREACSLALLNFSRLISQALFDAVPTYNVHPSLLPAFPGLDGVGDAHRAKALYQGATLHRVDAGVDTGRVVARTCRPVGPRTTLAERQHLAFRQKVLMVLSFIDLVRSGYLLEIDPSCEHIDPNTVGPEGETSPRLSDSKLADAARTFMAELQ